MFSLFSPTIFRFKGLPIWSFQNVETFGGNPDSSSSSKILPALRWSQKRFGLDTVLERVVQENLLLHIDFERTKGISFFSNFHFFFQSLFSFYVKVSSKPLSDYVLKFLVCPVDKQQTIHFCLF